MYDMTHTGTAEKGNKYSLQELFKHCPWKWKKHARHLLVRLNSIGNFNLNSFHSLFINIKIPHFNETYLHHRKET